MLIISWSACTRRMSRQNSCAARNVAMLQTYTLLCIQTYLHSYIHMYIYAHTQIHTWASHPTPAVTFVNVIARWIYDIRLSFESICVSTRAISAPHWSDWGNSHRHSISNNKKNTIARRRVWPRWGRWNRPTAARDYNTKSSKIIINNKQANTGCRLPCAVCRQCRPHASHWRM